MKNTQCSVAVVVPCYNEADRLDVATFQRFAGRHPELRFVMVDDGSHDATPIILQQMADAAPEQFTALRLQRNGGKAEAVRRGMIHAIQSGATFVAFLDADLAAPLEELPRLKAVLERNTLIQVAIGSRRAMLGHRIERRAVRRLLGRVFARVASGVLGLPIFDTQCGLKMFRCGEGVHDLFDQPFRSRWIFDVEILARLIARHGVRTAGTRIYEMPLERWREVPGSKLKSGDFAKALWELACIYTTYLRQSANDAQSTPAVQLGADPQPTLQLPAEQPPQRRAA